MKKLTYSLEDYLEAIYILELKNGFSRVKEISEFLDVSLPSVNKAICELKRKRFLNHKRYGYIKLTGRGKELAKDVFKLHSKFSELFKIFGMNDKKADKYACHIEHIIDRDDIRFIDSLVDYYKSNEKEIKNIHDFIRRRSNGRD
jgi:Mn-dependent DtxR family transcriptional regulator